MTVSPLNTPCQGNAYQDRLIGFDAEGTNLLYENNVVYNGDDCLAVGSPANNIVFRNSYCNGGHGLSVGSLGEDGAVAAVQNILYVVRVSVAQDPLTLPLKD